MQLSQIIIQKIQKSGPISFHDFMEMALYYPDLGYYTSEKKKIGREGDFYTSPVLSNLFGQMLGRQLVEMWHNMGKGIFTIVEFGAGTGALCFDILAYVKTNEEFYNSLEYCIIEKGTCLKSMQQEKLTEKVKWIDDISLISGFSGCVLSNEVLDNFSVHLVEMREDLMEIFVDYKDVFQEIRQPANDELKNYLKIQNISLPEGYRTEINTEALSWLNEISTHLSKGYVLTIDYGYTSREYYSPERKAGTLACFYQHTVSGELYQHIGQQDITAHVNFTALNIWGNKYGLDFAGYCNQNYFLRSLGLGAFLRELEINTSAENSNSLFQLNQLLMDMGHKFKVLVQQKGIDKKPLTGMQFSMGSL